MTNVNGPYGDVPSMPLPQGAPVDLPPPDLDPPVVAMLRQRRGCGCFTIINALVLLAIAVLFVYVAFFENKEPPTVVSTPEPTASADATAPPALEPPRLPLTPGAYFPNPTAATIDAQMFTIAATYQLAADEGDLWQIIPDTPANRTALQAFSFLLADLRVSGPTDATDEAARDLARQASVYEQRLLAQLPLGTDVNIDTGETAFTYNGTTGEGGWAEK